VEIREQLDADHRAATVVFQVIQGPRVRLGQVVVQVDSPHPTVARQDNLTLRSGELCRRGVLRHPMSLVSPAIFARWQWVSRPHRPRASEGCPGGGP
jgi:hypothetical protein